MKRRVWCLILAVSLIITLPAYTALAASERQCHAASRLSFNDTVAKCFFDITTDYSTDRISATMELRQGSTFIDRWSASGKGAVTINETATVSKNKTYKLIIAYTINGVAQDPISITRTNS